MDFLLGDLRSLRPGMSVKSLKLPFVSTKAMLALQVFTYLEQKTC